MNSRVAQTRLTNSTPQDHFLLCVLFLTPTIFFRFQDHHDGYVLQTSRFFVSALKGEMDYPFSQYGPLWSGLLGLIGFFSPDNSQLLGIRFFSVAAIATSLAISAKIFYLVSERRMPISLTMAVISSWYFYGPYYGWPSIFILPFVSLLSLRMCQVLKGIKPSGASIYLIGILIGLTQLARVQIGILLLISMILVFFIFLERSSIFKLLIGYFTSLLLAVLILASFGLLQDAIYDQYIFGLKFHISSDRGSTRIPIWTIAIGVLTWIIIANFQKRGRSFKLVYIGTCIVGTVLALLIVEILIPNEFLNFLHWRVIQRAYVGVTLGIVFFLLFSVINSVWSKKKRVTLKSDQQQLMRMTLNLIAICVFSQIYPLFSSHHSWYSSVPLLLAFVLGFKSQSEVSPPIRNRTSGTLLFLVLSYFLCWNVSNIISHERAPFDQLVLVDSVESDSLMLWKRFADQWIPDNSTVHNLCPDSTIFVVRRDLLPASRNYLWWNNFDKFSDYTDALRKPANFVLACNLEIPEIPRNLTLESYELVDSFENESRVDLYSLKTS